MCGTERDDRERSKGSSCVKLLIFVTIVGGRGGRGETWFERVLGGQEGTALDAWVPGETNGKLKLKRRLALTKPRSPTHTHTLTRSRDREKESEVE